MSTNIILFIVLGAVALCGLGVFLYFFFKKDNFYQKVELLLKNGEFQKVLSICEKRIDSQPHDFSIKYYMGCAYEGLKNFSSAIIYYEKACINASASEDDAIKSQLFTKTAELYRKMKKYPAAIGYYALVLDKAPNNLKALYACGEMLYEDKNYVKAKDYFEKLLVHQPENLRARFMLAKIYVQVKSLQEAAEQLEYIYSSDKLSHDVFRDNVTLLLGEVYKGLKNYQKAIDVLKPLMENESLFENVLIKLVEIHILFNRMDEVLVLINKYLNSVSRENKCELLYYLGTINFKKEIYYQAIKSWNDAYSLNENYRDLRDITYKFAKIIHNPKLETLYGEPAKTDMLIEKLCLPKEPVKLMRNKHFWSYKCGDFIYFLYRAPFTVPANELMEMTDLSIKEYRYSGSITLYSLFGMTNNADGVNYKSINLVSDNDLLALVTDKLR